MDLVLKITSKEHPKKQRQIGEYMRLHPEETNYRVIAKGTKVTQHTVAKHFEMIQKMLDIQETAPIRCWIARQSRLWYDDPIK